MRCMIIRRLTPFYLILPLIFTVPWCRKNESASQMVSTPPKRTEVALGRTLLHLTPNWGVAERLIAQGANVNAKDNFSMTPLHSAAHAGWIEMIELIIAKGADINAISNIGQTTLALAKAKGHIEISQLLHKYAAKE